MTDEELIDGLEHILRNGWHIELQKWENEELFTVCPAGSFIGGGIINRPTLREAIEACVTTNKDNIISSENRLRYEL